MKKILFCLFLLLSFAVFSQSKITETQKYKQIGLVWGLLKYHHPEISKGKYNWDTAFVALADKAYTIETQQELNDLLYTFIEDYKIDHFKLNNQKTNLDSKHLFDKNIDYQWINEAVYGEKLYAKLIEIRNNTNIGDYYAEVSKLTKMVSFDAEKGYENFDFTLKSNRLLVLYSFWNVIQYWDVNKYLMDEKWLNCLDIMTEEFLMANTKMQFELAKMKLISKLNDSHSYYYSSIINDSLFKYKSVFNTKIVNDSIVITGIRNQELASKDGIELGDIILKIENKSISNYLNEKLSMLLSSSNPSNLKKYGFWLFFNSKDSINVDLVTKKGVHANKYIHLYQNFKKDEHTESLILPKKDKWFMVKPDIAYINLEDISDKEVSVIFKQIDKTKGLILDLRNYPKNSLDITKYLLSERKDFVKVLFPRSNQPSVGEYDGKAPLHNIANPFKTGSPNEDYYKGKVVLLVDRRTISKAEYIGMTIQQSPNCLTIGEQTAGSVMNIVSYMMPDKTEVNFTGLGGFYPNGEGVQSNGLHIDYYVTENAKNYDADLYVKEAVKLIEK